MRRRGTFRGLFTRYEPARSPAALLRADREVVVFRGARRERLLRDLLGWCTDPAGDRIDACLIVAPGGQGKTRLATRLVANLRRRRGWRAGFVDPAAPARAIARLAASRDPLLLVVDHAEFRADQLEALADACAANPGRVRLMLLARSQGDWHTALAARGPALRALVGQCPVLALEPVETTVEGRVDAWLDAVTDLAEALGSLPTGRSIDWPLVARMVSPPEDLHTERYQAMLAIHTHALASLLDAVHPVFAEGDAAPDIVLAHEELWWRSTAARHHLDLTPKTLRLAAATATVFGAADRTEAATLVAALPGIADEQRQRVADWVATIRPASGLPHLLGEHLAATVLIGQTDALDGPARVATPAQWTNALDTLARASVNHPLTPAITHLLGVVPATAGPVATSVATTAQRPQPLVDALTMLADHADVELATTLYDTAPRDTVTLAEFTGHVLTSLVSRLRPLAASRPETMPALAASLTKLSGHLGQTERALHTSQEAVDTYRVLSYARPAYLPELAHSLTDVADRLTGLGRRDQAVLAMDEAVTTYRTLASSRPERFGPELASSLNVLSAGLAGLGRRDEALAAIDEALTIRRSLAKASPRPLWTVSRP